MIVTVFMSSGAHLHHLLPKNWEKPVIKHAGLIRRPCTVWVSEIHLVYAEKALRPWAYMNKERGSIEKHREREREKEKECVCEWRNRVGLERRECRPELREREQIRSSPEKGRKRRGREGRERATKRQQRHGSALPARYVLSSTSSLDIVNFALSFFLKTKNWLKLPQLGSLIR